MEKVLPKRGRLLFSFLLYVGLLSSYAFAQLPTATILGGQIQFALKVLF